MLISYLIIGGLSLALSIFLILEIKKNILISRIKKEFSLDGKTTINMLKELEKKYFKCSTLFLKKKDLCSNLYHFINDIPFGIVTIDIKNQTILSMNGLSKKFFNIKDKNVEGKKYYVVFRNYRFLSQIDSAIEEFENINKKKIEKELILDNGKPRYIKVDYIFPGNIVDEMIIIMTDITFQKELEEKSTKLISDVAHELRTPLTSIHGFAETLLQPGIDEKDKEKFLKIIESESSRLGRLINEILDVVRMDSKKIKMEFSEINLSELITYITEIAKEEAELKNIKILTDIEPNIKVMGNEDKLIQAFLNIIDNAIKYSSGIGTKVEIKLRKDNLNAILEINDDGPGIPSVYLDKIFERFFRVDKSRTKSQVSGSGLGLSIVKSIIDYHKGIIEVESEVGKGATFIIVLPLLNENNKSL